MTARELAKHDEMVPYNKMKTRERMLRLKPKAGIHAKIHLFATPQGVK